MLSVWICYKKKSVKYGSKRKQSRSQAALEIHYSTHTCMYLLFFSISLESELKKFSCFHCPELVVVVVDRQFKKEITFSKERGQDVHDEFSEFCREEQRDQLCSLSPLWSRSMDSNRHVDQPKFRAAACSVAPTEQVNLENYCWLQKLWTKTRVLSFFPQRPDLN